MSSTSFEAKRPVTVERTIGGKTLSIETGRLAKQASGAVVVRIGDTMSLVATVAAPGREGLDFFPLTVDYREKVYAAGKFPGGFMKREGRPTTKEILTSRLIDRPIRPLFPESYRNEVQIQAGPISADRQNDPDLPAMIGASATLLLAQVPFHGPIGGVRLARIEGKFVPFPTAEELQSSDLDLVVASTSKAIVMIEGFGEELPEPEMLEAIMTAHRYNQDIIALQHELLAAMGLPPYQPPEMPADPLRQALFDRFGHELREAKQIHGKAERNAAVKAIKERAVAEFAPEGQAEMTPLKVKSAFSAV
jgi:polyribonucleotide nucleotidyltransferase